jgi:1-acyl-sn-glycerol-3-phosphate acyltransferase
VNEVSTLEALDADRVAPPESLGAAVKRRVAGRYPVDPFGLDPQLANLVAPAVGAVLRVNVSGGEHVPESGPAAIVANRGFGIVEPSALALAVQRATGRRLRVVGAVPMPFVGSLIRRLGSIAATEDDVRAAIRAGHLVGVPLSPTWLRTGAGMPPHALMPALTHAPIIPAAVRPGGPFGIALGAWQVRFGPLVQLDEPYDPDDPLAAARFADAVRARVRGLLTE